MPDFFQCLRHKNLPYLIEKILKTTAYQTFLTTLVKQLSDFFLTINDVSSNYFYVGIVVFVGYLTKKRFGIAVFKRKIRYCSFFNARAKRNLRFRPKLVYDQSQSSAHPSVLRPKLQGLDGSSSALQSGRWSGDGLIRGQFGPKSLIKGGFEHTWL